MLQSVKNKNTWDLIWQFFKTDFKLKYNNSLLGFLWVLIKPLVLFGILYTVTSKIFVNQGIEHYPFFLLLGTIMNSFWNEGSTAGLNSIMGKSGLILKVNFPRYIVVISATLIPVINILINSTVFFFLMLFFKDNTSSLPAFNIVHFLWYVVCVCGLYVLISTFSLFASVLYVRFRDIQHIWELFLQMMFWLTPIVYNPYTLFKEEGFLKDLVIKYNPISVYIMSARDAIIYHDIKNPGLVFTWFAGSLVVLVFGYFYFKKAVKRVAEDF